VSKNLKLQYTEFGLFNAAVEKNKIVLILFCCSFTLFHENKFYLYRDCRLFLYYCITMMWRIAGSHSCTVVIPKKYSNHQEHCEIFVELLSLCDTAGSHGSAICMLVVFFLCVYCSHRCKSVDWSETKQNRRWRFVVQIMTLLNASMIGFSQLCGLKLFTHLTWNTLNVK